MSKQKPMASLSVDEVATARSESISQALQPFKDRIKELEAQLNEEKK